MDSPEFVVNTLRSPRDSRDFAVAAYLPATTAAGPPALPPRLDLRDKLPAVRNQGATNTCCAHSGCAIKEYHENKELGTDKAPLYFSPAFLYCQRSTAPSGGMYCRDMLEILRKQGVCEERHFPLLAYHREQAITPDAAVLALAAPFKVARYSAVRTLEEMKGALAAFGPVLMAFPVYHFGASFWKPERAGQAMVGGHAVVAVGYDDAKRALLLRNSWGGGWAEHGHTWYPYEEWGAHWEAWAVEDAATVNPPTPNNVVNLCAVGCWGCVGR